MTTTPMPIQRIRVDAATWAALEAAAPHGNRSAIIRDLIAWYLYQPGAALPTRPPRAADTGCTTACTDGHMYEAECVVSPMLMPVINIHADDDGPTRFSWQCYQGGDCEGLVHLGYPTLPAARRGYDRHLKAEHLSAS